MSSEPYLKPCPFCGGDVQFRKALDVSDGGTDAIIHRSGAECGMDVFSNFAIDESVITLWNKRANSVLIAGLRKIIADRPVAPHPVDVVRRMDAFMAEKDYPNVLGVGRDAENDRVLLVSFASRPDDDDLREFHEAIRERRRNA